MKGVVMVAWPLSREEKIAVLENGLSARADELTGEWVRVISRESGVVLGLCCGARADVVAGLNIFVQTGVGHTGRHVNIDNLQDLQEIRYLTAHGDSSSHGATWLHFLGAINTAWASYLSHHFNGLFDTMINMAGEGARRDGGGWEVLLAHLLELQFQDSRYYGGALLELKWLVREFARREHQEIVSFTQANGLPRPAWPKEIPAP
jgi:hypothetical protein